MTLFATAATFYIRSIIGLIVQKCVSNVQTFFINQRKQLWNHSNGRTRLYEITVKPLLYVPPNHKT